MSFSCPHFDMDHEACLRLSRPCAPGQQGCVLCENSRFAIPVEQREASQEELPRHPLLDALRPKQAD